MRNSNCANVAKFTQLALTFRIVLCILLVAATQTSANCRFYFNLQFGYTCELNDVIVTEDNFNLVINTDNHSTGQSDASVRSLSIGNGTILRFFPNSILRQFPSIRYMVLDHSGLQELNPGNFGGCENVVILFIRHSSVRRIPAGLFSDCTRMQVLDLSDNLISEIDEDAFVANTNLLELDINDNQFTTIQSGLFRNLEILEILNLRNNGISEIEDGAFANLHNLIIFYLRNNLLTELRPAMFGDVVENLVFFNLNQNLLERVPRLPSRAPELKYIYLENNLIADIRDDDFSFAYSNITNIELSGNALRTLTSNAFASLVRLDILQVNDNMIQSVDDTFFARIPSLYTFYFRNNACANIRFDNIRSIDQNNAIARAFDGCYYNFIEPTQRAECDFEIHPTTGYTCVLTNITFRNFRDKFRITGTHLPGFFNDIVTGLRISDSNFVRVPPSFFQTFPNIRFFTLTNSQLSRIERDTFVNCGRIHSMDLSGNRIRRLGTDALVGCYYIEELNLDNNQITEIEPCNSFLTNIYQTRIISMRNNICVNQRFEGADWLISDAPRLFYQYINRCFSLWYEFLEQP